MLQQMLFDALSRNFGNVHEEVLVLFVEDGQKVSAIGLGLVGIVAGSGARTYG